jgi:hypothetical protein
VIVCSNCGKENQDHYKFCLGCGNELRRPQPQPPDATPHPVGTPKLQSEDEAPTVVPSEPAGSPADMADTSPGGLPSPLAAKKPERVVHATAPPPSGPSLPTAPVPPASSRPPAPAAPSKGDAACPKCGGTNPPGFVFCGNCGFKLLDSDGATTFLGGAPAKKPEGHWGEIFLIRPDGSEGGHFQLTEPEMVIGRGSGPLFDQDGYLSPNHASLKLENGRVLLTDVNSLNGVFVKISGEVSLEPGNIFRIGQELLRFDVIYEPEVCDDGTEIMGSPNPGYWGRLSLIAGPDIDGSAFPLMGEEMMIGRERGDILFPDDGYVSGIHAKIAINSEGYTLADLNSSNGTFMKIGEPTVIKSGTFILMGQQLFRFELS